MPVRHDEAQRRFSSLVEGHEAVLHYTLSGNAMNIVHTFVPPPIEGRGVAAELMHAALDAASHAGWTVHPMCSYALAYMRRAETAGGT